MSWFTSELSRLSGNLDFTETMSDSVETISEGIDWTGQGLKSGWNTLWESGHGGMSFDDTMSEGANLFSNVHHGTWDKFQRGFGQETGKMRDAFGSWDQQEGILGLGSPNATIPTVGGSSSPNLEQFSIGDKNFQKIMGKLHGRGYVHETLEGIFADRHDYTMEELVSNIEKDGMLDTMIKPHLPSSSWFPGKKYLDRILGGAISGKEQELLQSLTDSASSALTPSEEEEEVKVKGPGTLRGREATLKLNLGAKGLGRKSLRIGTKGMGKPKTGKYREYRSGRTSRGYG